jgi:hypothetical protein
MEKAPRPHFVAHNGGTKGPFSIQSGSWKLVQPAGGARAGGGKSSRGLDEGSKNIQLYDLGKDIAEKNNLAKEKPDKVAELQALLKQIQTP